MLEVPFSLVLFVIILVFVLGVFSIVMIVRMVMQQMSGDDEDADEETDTTAAGKQEAKPGNLPVPENCKPLLLIGLDDRRDEIQFFRAAAGMSAIKAGQVSRTDGILLKKVAQCIQLLTAETAVPVEKAQAAVEPSPAENGGKSMPITGAPVTSAKPKAAARPVSVPSVATQINEVLQTMLGTSSGPVPNLRLEDSPTGDVRIWLDSQSYSSIEDVPNPTAVAFLRKAAEQWSESQHL